MSGLEMTAPAIQKAVIDSTLGAGLVSAPLWMQYLENVGVVTLVLLGCAIAIFRLFIMRYEYRRIKEKVENHK